LQDAFSPALSPWMFLHSPEWIATGTRPVTGATEVRNGDPTETGVTGTGVGSATAVGGIVTVIMRPVGNGIASVN